MLDYQELRDQLESEWLRASDRDDRWGRIMTLAALVDLDLAEVQREMTHDLRAFQDTLPFWAKNLWPLAGSEKRAMGRLGPLTRAGRPTARMRREKAGADERFGPTVRP